jgi:hypothetical protein
MTTETDDPLSIIARAIVDEIDKQARVGITDDLSCEISVDGEINFMSVARAALIAIATADAALREVFAKEQVALRNEMEAAYAFVETMLPRADRRDDLMWHGWALREAFIAGAEWREQHPANATGDEAG